MAATTPPTTKGQKTLPPDVSGVVEAAGFGLLEVGVDDAAGCLLVGSDVVVDASGFSGVETGDAVGLWLFSGLVLVGCGLSAGLA